MIGLKKQRVTAGERCFDMGGRFADISQHPQPTNAIGDRHLRGLTRIVRHRERLHFKLAHQKRVVRIEATQGAAIPA